MKRFQEEFVTTAGSCPKNLTITLNTQNSMNSECLICKILLPVSKVHLMVPSDLAKQPEGNYFQQIQVTDVHFSLKSLEGYIAIGF